MDNRIYCQGHDGAFIRVGEPEKATRPNFLILYEGLDWSGFRTLAECEAQLPELAARKRNCHFEVVERF